MAIFNSLEKLPNRFLDGFSNMGYVSRSPRTDSPAKIIESINAYAKTNPEIAEFTKHISELDPKHLGLAHDVIDLSNCHTFLNTNINLKTPISDSQTIMGYILNKIPLIGKKNPSMLELSQKVINSSDSENAKYFLTRLFDHDIENMSALANQTNAVTEIVPDIAKETLKGGYLMDFSKNEKFFRTIQCLISPKSKPENIRLINKISEILDKFCKKIEGICYLDEITNADTKVLKENLTILPDLLKNAESQGLKEIDVSDFLTRNTNIK